MGDYRDLSDADIDAFVDWLRNRESLGKQSINLVINTIVQLKKDRLFLAREVAKLKFNEPWEPEEPNPDPDHPSNTGFDGPTGAN